VRDAYRALLPDGLTFRPSEKAPRRAWSVTGTAKIDEFRLKSDPNGIRAVGNQRFGAVAGIVADTAPAPRLSIAA
jgi:hypothetical protein